MGRIFTAEWKRKISEAKKGKPSPRKGCRVSEESKEKMRKAHIGKTHTPETKEKLRLLWLNKRHTEETKRKMSISAGGTGVPHERTGYKQSLYKSTDWKVIRKSIYRRDNFTCQMCGKRHSKLNVHHIDYDVDNCTSNNLITLCQSCHCKTSKGNRDYWYNFFQGYWMARGTI